MDRGPRPELPASRLTALILEGLRAGLEPDGTIGPLCLYLERMRYHLFAEASAWGKNTIVSWEDEAWPFLVVDYLLHAQDCPNGFHLQPMIRHDLAAPLPSKRITVMLVSRQRMERERASSNREKPSSE